MTNNNNICNCCKGECTISEEGIECPNCNDEIGTAKCACRSNSDLVSQRDEQVADSLEVRK